MDDNKPIIILEDVSKERKAKSMLGVMMAGAASIAEKVTKRKKKPKFIPDSKYNKQSKGTGEKPNKRPPTKRQRDRMEQRKMRKTMIRRNSNTKGAKLMRQAREEGWY